MRWVWHGVAVVDPPTTCWPDVPPCRSGPTVAVGAKYISVQGRSAGKRVILIAMWDVSGPNPPICFRDGAAGQAAQMTLCDQRCTSRGRSKRGPSKCNQFHLSAVTQPPRGPCAPALIPRQKPAESPPSTSIIKAKRCLVTTVFLQFWYRPLWQRCAEIKKLRQMGRMQNVGKKSKLH